MTKLYLDDERALRDDSYILVRSYEEAVTYVKNNGIPDFISFDNDLGVDENNNLLPTGYDFAKWLVDQDESLNYLFPENFSFNVHCENLKDKQTIETYLNSCFSGEEYKVLNAEYINIEQIIETLTSSFSSNRYIRSMNKIDNYNNLYTNVEVNIINLLVNCKDENIIKKYNDFYVNEMNDLRGKITKENVEKLKEVKKELDEKTCY